MNLEAQIRSVRNHLASLKHRLRDAELELHHNPTDPVCQEDVRYLEDEIDELEEELEELEYEEEREADEA